MLGQKYGLPSHKCGKSCIYIATPAINYRCYSNNRATHSHCRARSRVDRIDFFARVYFLNVILCRIVNYLFCNLVCVHVHKICDDKFGGCKKLCSWLDQKVNKNIANGMTSSPSKTSRHRSVF